MPRDKMTVFCGPSRFGQVVAGAGHDLRRGAAALRRVAVAATPGSSSGRCRSRGSNTSPGCRRRSASSRRRRARARASTVGTVTEIYDYLRILYARLGQRVLPELPASRSARRRPTRSSRRCCRCPRGRSSTSWPRWSARGRRSTTTLFDEIRRAGLRADARRRQVATTSTSRRRSTTAASTSVEVVVDRNVVQAGHADPHRRGGRAGARPRPRRDARRPRRRRDATSRSGRSRRYSPAPRLRAVRPELRAAEPAPLLVQQPARLVPDVRGARRPARGERRPAPPRHRGCHSATGRVAAWPTLDDGSPWLPFAEALAQHVGFSLDTPFDEARPGAPAGDPARHRRRVDRVRGERGAEARS